jgi:hypothetical protein
MRDLVKQIHISRLRVLTDDVGILDLVDENDDDHMYSLEEASVDNG